MSSLPDPQSEAASASRPVALLLTCPTCGGIAYVPKGEGLAPCHDCEPGRKIADRLKARYDSWMKKRGITPPAPRKAVERPPMWNEKETE